MTPDRMKEKVGKALSNLLKDESFRPHAHGNFRRQWRSEDERCPSPDERPVNETRSFTAGRVGKRRPGRQDPRTSCLSRVGRAKVGAMSLRIATFNVENLMNRFDFSGFPQPAQPGPDAGALPDQGRGGIPAAGAGARDCAYRRHAPTHRARHRRDPRRHHLPAGGRQYRGAEGLRIRLSLQDDRRGLPAEIHDPGQ